MATKIYQASDFRHEVKVHRIDGEYRARLYCWGKADTESDYFTSDKDDAIGTANFMLAQAMERTFSDMVGYALYKGA